MLQQPALFRETRVAQSCNYRKGYEKVHPGAIDVDVSKLNMTGDQQYLAEGADTKLPLLLVYGRTECKLFAQLLLEQPTQQVRLHHTKYIDR